MGAKLIQVIEVHAHRGAGTEENPHRVVTEYYSTDGKFLADDDPLKKRDGSEAVSEMFPKASGEIEAKK